MDTISNDYRVKGLLKSLQDSITEYENDNLLAKQVFTEGEINGMRMALNACKVWLNDDEEGKN